MARKRHRRIILVAGCRVPFEDGFFFALPDRCSVKIKCLAEIRRKQGMMIAATKTRQTRLDQTGPDQFSLMFFSNLYFPGFYFFFFLAVFAPFIQGVPGGAWKGGVARVRLLTYPRQHYIELFNVGCEIRTLFYGKKSSFTGNIYRKKLTLTIVPRIVWRVFRRGGGGGEFILYPCMFSSEGGRRRFS